MGDGLAFGVGFAALMDSVASPWRTSLFKVNTVDHWIYSFVILFTQRRSRLVLLRPARRATRVNPMDALRTE
jgi:hypothetical protein